MNQKANVLLAAFRAWYNQAATKLRLQDDVTKPD
jgi:hypothetical protein